MKRRTRQATVSIICVDDTEMRRMNRQFRNKNKTTDVLTFVDDEFVEIYISIPVARRQARERKITLLQECQRLIVHGLCHAAGYDHHTVPDFQKMRRREFEVLVQCAID
jgi:probable rRNA maturation factor